ncbi:MAG: hypothetical protein A2143_00645 [Gallionellales bacterium RBG_16_57_15]|nr:MAG: hypothetical protein A2143_00645 [Gallionellales bacterium RBG_16_57_15]
MDWKKLIQEIIATGMTQVAIAEEIGVKQPSIVDVLQGRTQELKWSNGQRLIKLHSIKCAAPKRKAVA